MLNSHENLLTPKSNLLRVGAWVVDIARREVGAPGIEAPRRISVKAMQVLLVLVAHHRKVVSREALLEWVWSDTLPSDDVLTQAVTQIRKAFGDERESRRYMETISKGGYRLIADVTWLPTQQVPDVPMAATEVPQVAGNPATALDGQDMSFVGDDVVPPESPLSAPQRGRVRSAIFAACSCLALLLGYVGYSWRDSLYPRLTSAANPADQNAAIHVEALPYTLIAAQPALEIQPSLSPDGSLVAYSMPTGTEGVGNAIHVQATDAVPPTVLTEPPKYSSDVAPRWSPSGREIAFMRISGETCELSVVPASGGVPRSVGPCPDLQMRKYDWLPDGHGLIAGSADDQKHGARLSILDLRTGEWTPIRYEATTGDVDFDPHVSPDGRWVVFRRNVSNSDFWRMPLAGGKPERLTKLGSNIYGWAWMPDGKSLVFSYLDEQVQIARVDLASGAIRKLGVQDATWLDIAARAPVMTFAVVSRQTGIYRRRNPAGDASDTAERLFPSSGSELLPGISPNGRHIAFYSNRTRSLRLWVGRMGDPRSVSSVGGLLPVPRHPPRWLDDKTVLILAHSAEASTKVAEVYSIDIASGRYTRLDVPAGITPIAVDPMPGKRMLVVTDEGSGSLSLKIMDTASTPWRVLATRPNVGEARYDQAGKGIWFVEANAPGLWRANDMLAGERKIDPAMPAKYWMKLWLLVGSKPYVTSATYDCAMGWRGLGEPVPATCLEGEIHHTIGEPVLSMDQQWLYYSASTGPDNSDIALAHLPTDIK